MKVTSSIILKFLKHHGYLLTYKNGPCNSIIVEKKMKLPENVPLKDIGKWYDEKGSTCTCCKIKSMAKK